MGPSRVSYCLNNIALQIERVDSPSRESVSRSIGNVLAAMNSESQVPAYSWDEVICEVCELMVDLPDNLSDEEAVLLVDDQFMQGVDDALASYDKQTRVEDGVVILDSKFGLDKVARTYLSREDPAKAKALAEEELTALLL